MCASLITFSFWEVLLLKINNKYPLKGANMYHILKTTGASSRASLGLTYGVQDL